MDSKRQGGSAPSFTSELFGNREHPSTDVFASIFPPPKGVGRSSAGSEMVGSWQQHSSGSTRRDDVDKSRGSGYHSAANRERSSAFQGERADPCHLSSSLYYGGQESYSQSKSSHTSASYTTLLSSTRMLVKTIQLVLGGGTGGKDLCIIEPLRQGCQYRLFSKDAGERYNKFSKFGIHLDKNKCEISSILRAGKLVLQPVI